MKTLRGQSLFAMIFLAIIVLSFNTKGQSISWTYITGGSVYSSPTYYNGAIYIGSDDSTLYCLDAVTGSEKWKYKTQGIIRCKPDVENGVVYFASDDGSLYSLNAVSGVKNWNFDIGNKIIRVFPDPTNFTGNYWDYMQSSPCLSNGVVYVGSGDSCLYAVNALDGSLKWKKKTNNIVRSSPCVQNNVVYVGSWDGYIYAVNTNDGSEKWKFNTSGSQYVNVQPSPRVVDSLLYCGSRNPMFYAINVNTGEKVWSYSYGSSWVESSAEIFDSLVFVGSSDLNFLYAFKKTTGKVIWRCLVPGDTWSSPFYDNGVVYVGLASYKDSWKKAAGGGILAIDAFNGKIKWQIICATTPYIGGVVSSPIVHNNIVYYGSLDGKVYAVSTIITGINEQQGSLIPGDYKLENYPNPFNPETRIRFTIPKSGSVNLSVFDALGKNIAELINKDLNAGTYEVTFNPGALASGVYYPVLKAGDVVKVTKTLYLK